MSVPMMFMMLSYIACTTISLAFSGNYILQDVLQLNTVKSLFSLDRLMRNNCANNVLIER